MQTVRRALLSPWAGHVWLRCCHDGRGAAQALEDGARRIDLGGKFMTNYLKELVSFRRVSPGRHSSAAALEALPCSGFHAPGVAQMAGAWQCRWDAPGCLRRRRHAEQAVHAVRVA